MTRQLACLCLLATFSTVNVAADSEAGPWRPLLDAKLSSFDVYLSYHGKDILGVIQGKAPKDLKPIGLNPKDQTVFSVSEEKGKPLLRISGEFYGCQFRQPISPAALSAALLRSTPGEPSEVPATPADPIAELRDLNEDIERLAHKLEEAIERLSSKKNGSGV